MKTKIVVLCEVTGEPIGQRPGLILNGTIHRFDPDSTDGLGEIILGDRLSNTEGKDESQAYLASEFVKIVAPPKKERAAPTPKNEVALDQLVKFVVLSEVSLTVTEIASKLNADPNKVRALLTQAAEEGKLTKVKRGRFTGPAANGEALPSVKQDSAGGVSA